MEEPGVPFHRPIDFNVFHNWEDQPCHYKNNFWLFYIILYQITNFTKLYIRTFLIWAFKF